MKVLEGGLRHLPVGAGVQQRVGMQDHNGDLPRNESEVPAVTRELLEPLHEFNLVRAVTEEAEREPGTLVKDRDADQAIRGADDGVAVEQVGTGRHNAEREDAELDLRPDPAGTRGEGSLHQRAVRPRRKVLQGLIRSRRQDPGTVMTAHSSFR